MSIYKQAQDLILKLKTENEELRAKVTSFEKQAQEQSRGLAAEKIASQFNLGNEEASSLSNMSHEHLSVLEDFGSALVGDQSFAEMENRKVASVDSDYENSRQELMDFLS